MNLLVNANEAMDHTPSEIRLIVVGTELADDLMMRVSVKDSGPGIGPEAMHRIFEPFYTSKNGGMGLGLTVCRSIIDAHGGEIWATRNDDLGSSLHFTIPIAS